eukprot:COSAG02_NODE_1214_length_13857_cov_17.738334_11_plen_79_part_00
MNWVTRGACCRKPGIKWPHTPRCNIVLLGGVASQETCLPLTLLGISAFAAAKQPTYDSLFPVSPTNIRPHHKTNAHFF